MFPYTSALYVNEAEKTSCPTQTNAVFKKHFLLLEGRRLGFHGGRQPVGAGARGHMWCILPVPTATRSSPTSRHLEGHVWPQALL